MLLESEEKGRGKAVILKTSDRKDGLQRLREKMQPQ